jgi:tetratricopeptide (TPR) repeat protein
MAGAAAAGRPGTTPPGREDDLRDVLALLDGHRVVAVAGGRGFGKSTLLEWVAARYGVSLHRGAAPKRLSPGDLVVLDDADTLSKRALAGLVRRTLEAHGRILMAVKSAAHVPASAAVHRLRDLPWEDAQIFLGSICTRPGVPVEALVDLVGGHPGLLVTLGEIAGSGRGRPRTLAAIRSALAERLNETWVAPLPQAVRRGAALLVAAGGWLPVTLDVRGFSAAAESLVEAGLAELDDGAVVASPILLAARHDAPSRATVTTAVAALARQASIERAGVRLAEAQLRHWLGDDGAALEALREAHRFHRGTSRADAYERSVIRLVSEDATPLAGAARLAVEIHRFGSRRDGETAIETAKKLLDRGALEPEEVLEARTFVAYVRMSLGDGDAALPELVRVAEEAAGAGDRYAETQALLWQAWIHTLGDDPQVAARVASRAVRLARRADAPALQARALFCLARCDLAEGDFDAAGRRLEQALRLCRRHRLDDDQTVVLDALADLAGRVGRPSEAAEHLDAADALIGRTGNLPRKAELTATRAEVALRRGHVSQACRILLSSELAVMEDGWRRDLLRAEAALASGDLSGAKRALGEMSRPPALSRSWRRRRAALGAGLLEEGVDPGVDLAECAGDPVAALRLEAARGRIADAAERAEALEAESFDDDPEGWLLLKAESIRLRLLRGRIDEAIADLRELRGRLVPGGPPTAKVLLLEAVEHMGRGEPLLAAKCAVLAHRAAISLGHRRVAGDALDCLLAAHLALGRGRGLGYLLTRSERLARKLKSPIRQARAAAWRAAAAIRFGATPEKDDVAAARKGSDPIAAAFVARLVDGEAPAPAHGADVGGLATWLAGLLLTGETEGPAFGQANTQAAIELRLDGDRREVVLAGGKRVSFARRRVLWRLLWKLFDTGGGAIDPEPLYRVAWELPFNTSRLNSLYVGIRRLRLLVEPDPSSPRIILASSQGGYYMDVRRVSAVGPSPMSEDEAD